MKDNPLITIILPVRNEGSYIRRCLDSILDQTISKDLLEVLVIDGNSDDATPEIVRSYSRQFRYIKLLKNPEQNTIDALNLGIKNASGDFIVRVDGHSYLEKDYIEQCIKALECTDADNVGGGMRPVGDTYLQKAIAFATSSVFGIGRGKFHYSDKKEYVDTVYLGAFRRQVFDKVGSYDPEMHYSEDNELNLRIAKKGGKILLSPKIRSYYFPRESLKEVWRQYFKYGYFKPKVLQKHNLSISFRHFVPAFLVASLVATATLSFFRPLFGYFFYGIFACYLSISFLFSLYISINNGIRYLPIMPIVFATLHLSYGTGFIKGLLDFLLLKK
ncbi:MAG: glycosyltransferase family 2 protein [Thermodesulfobacteriota bacterium]|jgi:glycosyltransferase involved in cell wall biosynthesis|nr:MAG: glycosyltransferase family 2 protein [Thermodesulfobacteriota bacterium]